MAAAARRGAATSRSRPSATAPRRSGGSQTTPRGRRPGPVPRARAAAAGSPGGHAWRSVRLAVSLHSACQATRHAIMPATAREDATLEQLAAAMDYHAARSARAAL
jgi:hypothetical protein